MVKANHALSNSALISWPDRQKYVILTEKQISENLHHMVKIHALCNLSDSRKLALNNNYCVTTVLCLEGGPLFCLWEKLIETLF